MVASWKGLGVEIRNEKQSRTESVLKKTVKRTIKSWTNLNGGEQDILLVKMKKFNPIKDQPEWWRARKD